MQMAFLVQGEGQGPHGRLPTAADLDVQLHGSGSVLRSFQRLQHRGQRQLADVVRTRAAMHNDSPVNGLDTQVVDATSGSPLNQTFQATVLFSSARQERPAFRGSVCSYDSSRGHDATGAAGPPVGPSGWPLGPLRSLPSRRLRSTPERSSKPRVTPSPLTLKTVTVTSGVKSSGLATTIDS